MDGWIFGWGEVLSTLREKRRRKRTTVLRFIFDTILSSTKTSLPLITLSSSGGSARIGNVLNSSECDLICLMFPVKLNTGWIGNVTCRDFLRQHQQPRHHTPRLPHSSDKVHILLLIHCHNNDDHRGVSVVEEHGEVGATDDGGDLGGARAFARCAVRQPV